MGKKSNCEFSDFDCGMIVVARRAGLNISVTADLLGQKTSSEQQFWGQRCVDNVRGQRRRGQTGRC